VIALEAVRNSAAYLVTTMMQGGCHVLILVPIGFPRQQSQLKTKFRQQQLLCPALTRHLADLRIAEETQEWAGYRH
jgi:hypothetical protein